MILLAVLGLFLFASGPVLMAATQDTNSNMPTFMNSMYMFINFGVGAVVVFVLGSVGDLIGLEQTYKYCVVFALGTIPAALLLNRFSTKSS